MPVILPQASGIIGFNAAGKPTAYDPRASIWFRAGQGVPRYEDLMTCRLLERSHTVSIPLDTVIRQVTSTPFAIVPVVDKPTSAHETACECIEAILDGRFNRNLESFDSLCTKWVNDIECIDAGVLELVPDEDGWLAEIYARDGATFTKNPDEHGCLPLPGDDTPAYYQVGTTGYAPNATGVAELWNSADSMRYLSYIPSVSVPFSRDQLVWTEENPSTAAPYGFGRVQKVQRIVEVLANQDISNLKYFPQNEIPEGLMNIAELNQSELERFRAYWDKEVKGRPHKLPITTAKGVQYIPFRASPRELEFLESQRWYHQLVWMTFGVTQNEVGDLADVNRNTAEQQSITVWRKTTLPLLGLLAKEINRKILPFIAEFWDVDGEVEFRWLSENPVAVEAERRRQSDDLRIGAKTINQVNVERGDPEVPWGGLPLDVYQSLARTQPEWFVGEFCEGITPPDPIFGGGFLSAHTPQVKAAKTGEDDDPAEFRRQIQMLTRKVGATLSDALEPLFDELGTLVPLDTDDDTEPQEMALSSTPDMSKAPLTSVATILSRIDIAGALAPVVGPFVEEAVERAASQEAEKIIEATQQAVGDDWDVVLDLNLQDTAAYRILRDRSAARMKHVDQTVKDRVNYTLSQIIQDGGNVNDARTALTQTVDSLTANHAELVARTEILSSSRAGVQALGESARDIIEGKTWRARSGRRTRTWHAAMNGVTVGIDDAFEVPDVGAPDQPRDYPKTVDIVGEDQPYNCRCSMQLQVKDILPGEARAYRGVTCLKVLPAGISGRQREILIRHGLSGETAADMIRRCEHDMSKNEIARHLGISKATVYAWRDGA